MSKATAQTRIRNNIRTLRFQHGEMTQDDLGTRVGLTRQTIIAIEQSRYSPSLEAAFKIAQVFRVPLEEVFQYGVETDAKEPAS
jgi:putative transcriptional regulator